MYNRFLNGYIAENKQLKKEKNTNGTTFQEKYLKKITEKDEENIVEDITPRIRNLTEEEKLEVRKYRVYSI